MLWRPRERTTGRKFSSRAGARTGNDGTTFTESDWREAVAGREDSSTTQACQFLRIDAPPPHTDWRGTKGRREIMDKVLEPCRRLSGSVRAYFNTKEEAEEFAADPANWPAYKGDIAH